MSRRNRWYIGNGYPVVTLRHDETCNDHIFKVVIGIKKNQEEAGLLQEPPADACIFMQRWGERFFSRRWWLITPRSSPAQNALVRWIRKQETPLAVSRNLSSSRSGDRVARLRLRRIRPMEPRDYLVALLSALYHRQRALRHLERLATRTFSTSFSLSLSLSLSVSLWAPPLIAFLPTFSVRSSTLSVQNFNPLALRFSYSYCDISRRIGYFSIFSLKN